MKLILEWAPEAARAKGKGKRAGTKNYTEKEFQEMFRLVEKELPLDERGWMRVHQKYAFWATEQSLPVRQWCHLESKFKKVRF